VCISARAHGSLDFNNFFAIYREAGQRGLHARQSFRIINVQQKFVWPWKHSDQAEALGNFHWRI